MKIILGEGKKVDAEIKSFIIKSDQSIALGGEASAPDPFTYFLASIGLCIGIYANNFCQKRNIPTENIEIVQSYEFNKEKKLYDEIEINIKLPEEFPQKYKKALLNSVNLCTVKKHLLNPPKITTNIL